MFGIVLKIPITAALYIVWYSTRAVPETDDEAPPAQEDHHFRRFRREPKPPRPPRRPSHGGAAMPLPHPPAGRTHGSAKQPAATRVRHAPAPATSEPSRT